MLQLVQVGHLEMFLIMGTTVVTVAVNLNYAVLTFAVMFHMLKRRYGEAVRDLSSEESKHAVHNDMAWVSLGLDGGYFSTDRA